MKLKLLIIDMTFLALHTLVCFGLFRLWFSLFTNSTLLGFLLLFTLAGYGLACAKVVGDMVGRLTKR